MFNMKSYREMIADCEREVNRLHATLWETVEHRDKSPNQREQWHRAADAFRNHQSPIDDLIDQCLEFGLEHDNDLRHFAFAYIDNDPYFFRSGYILESLLQRVKKLSLTELEKESIRQTILKRVETRALRNFRHLCRLIPRIEDDQFRYELRSRAKSKDPQMRRRAEFALSYLR